MLQFWRCAADLDGASDTNKKDEGKIWKQVVTTINLYLTFTYFTCNWRQHKRPTCMSCAVVHIRYTQIRLSSVRAWNLLISNRLHATNMTWLTSWGDSKRFSGTGTRLTIPLYTTCSVLVRRCWHEVTCVLAWAERAREEPKAMQVQGDGHIAIGFSFLCEQILCVCSYVCVLMCVCVCVRSLTTASCLLRSQP